MDAATRLWMRQKASWPQSWLFLAICNSIFFFLLSDSLLFTRKSILRQNTRTLIMPHVCSHPDNLSRVEAASLRRIRARVTQAPAITCTRTLPCDDNVQCPKYSTPAPAKKKKNPTIYFGRAPGQRQSAKVYVLRSWEVFNLKNMSNGSWKIRFISLFCSVCMKLTSLISFWQCAVWQHRRIKKESANSCRRRQSSLNSWSWFVRPPNLFIIYIKKDLLSSYLIQLNFLRSFSHSCFYDWLFTLSLQNERQTVPYCPEIRNTHGCLCSPASMQLLVRAVLCIIVRK